MDATQLVPHERPLELLTGAWKRCLTSRHFGTFALGRDANSVVVVEQLPLPPDALAPPAYAPPYGGGGAPAAPTPGYRLRWSFGRTPGDVRAGYHIEPLFDAARESLAGFVGPAGAINGSPRVVPLRVTYAGSECTGTWQPDLGLLMVHLTAAAGTATVIYRVLDDDTLAVCITEVPAGVASGAGGGGGGGARRAAAEPTVQHGFMFRLPPGPALPS